MSCELGRAAVDPVLFRLLLAGSYLSCYTSWAAPNCHEAFLSFCSIQERQVCKLPSLATLNHFSLLFFVSIPHSDNRIQSGRQCCCACPSPCAPTFLCSPPLGELIPGSSFTPSTRAALGALLLQVQGGKPYSPPSGECIACEKPTQQGGHLLREKSPWTVLFLAARENTDIYLWHWCQVTFRLAHAQELFGLEGEEK